MSHRLLVNPGTPQAWEISLHAGINRLGRSEHNDFTISHPSVSSSHCEIVVNETGVWFKDLGSTNGSFVNGAPLSDGRLEAGQQIRLGSVDLVLAADGDTAIPAPVTATLDSESRIVIRPSPLRPTGTPLRIAQTNAPELMTAPDEPPIAPPLTPEGSPGPRLVGAAVCRYHPKTPARFLCERCQKYFCDLCVTTRTVGTVPGYHCRNCGEVCVHVKPQLPATRASRGFFACLPDAFAYPIRGSGIFLLVGGTVLYLLLQGGMILTGLGGWRFFTYGLIVQVTVGGYLFAFLQSILHTTATGDNEMPLMPGVTNMWEDVFLPVLQLLGMILTVFSPALLLLILAVRYEQPLFGIAAIPAMILGGIYFPMAFLAVVTLDTLKAVNPLVIVPSIFRVPLEYFVTLVLFAVIYGLRALGDFVLDLVFPEGLLTKSMVQLFLMITVWAVWSVVGFYLITVNVRILGLLYVTKQDKLGWLHR